MCGFTGYFDPAFNHEEWIIKEMSNQIISRGPDSFGIHINRDIGISLGHRSSRYKIFQKMVLNQCKTIVKIHFGI